MNDGHGRPELRADFAPIYAASPWPLLMFGMDGAVLGASDEHAVAGDDTRPADAPLRERAPQYLAALRGAVAWLTPQRADILRTRPSGTQVQERLFLRRCAWGSCLSVVDDADLRQQPPVDAQTARLAALGFIVAGVCHEITNPLTSLHSMVQILRAEQQPSQGLLDKGLNNIAGNVQRILDISRRLITFARVGDEPRTRFAIDDAVEEALYVLRQDGLLQHVELHRQTDADAVVVGNVGQAREIFLNLFVNAVQAMRHRGTLEVSTLVLGSSVEVRIADSGPGVPDALRARIFEPFFTTKEETHGTGLGLAISNEIALEHGGVIELRRGASRGATFAVVLPGAPT